VKSFANNKAKKYKNFTVKYVRGSAPVLKCFDEDHLAQTISINSWDEDAIVEFVEEKLVQ